MPLHSWFGKVISRGIDVRAAGNGNPQLSSTGHKRLSQRNHRILVAAAAHLAFGEDAVAGDPVDGLGVGFFGVGLEDQALAGAPAAGVHLRVEALGEFVLVVMRVAVGAQVEVALRAAQGAEEFAQVFRVRVAADHRRDHEGRVDVLREPSCSAK